MPSSDASVVRKGEGEERVRKRQGRGGEGRERRGEYIESNLAPSNMQVLACNPIPAKCTGIPGIIPGFSVSSRYPGISVSIPGLSRVSASPPGIPELVLSVPGIGD